MRMIAGLEDPTSGEIRIDGERVNDVPARDRDLAMVFQNYGLYPHMTVAENIGYPLKVRGVPRAEREARVRAAARSEEHTSELQSLMRTSYAVFCLKKKNISKTIRTDTEHLISTHKK